MENNALQTALNNFSDDKPTKYNFEKRQKILQYLLRRFKHGTLVRGTMKAALERFDRSERTKRRLWRLAATFNPGSYADYDVRTIKINCRQKRKKWNFQVSMAENIPLSRRGTLRDLSSTTTTPATTWHHSFKEGTHFKGVLSTVAPFLIGDSKILCLRYCLNHLDSNCMFDAVCDEVYIEESLCYISTLNRNYYVLMIKTFRRESVRRHDT